MKKVGDWSGRGKSDAFELADEYKNTEFADTTTGKVVGVGVGVVLGIFGGCAGILEGAVGVVNTATNVAVLTVADATPWGDEAQAEVDSMMDSLVAAYGVIKENPDVALSYLADGGIDMAKGVMSGDPRAVAEVSAFVTEFAVDMVAGSKGTKSLTRKAADLIEESGGSLVRRSRKAVSEGMDKLKDRARASGKRKRGPDNLNNSMPDSTGVGSRRRPGKRPDAPDRSRGRGDRGTDEPGESAVNANRNRSNSAADQHRTKTNDGGGGCFAAGTKVLTKHGHKDIEQVKPGDQVWSRSDTTGTSGFKRVARVFVTHPTRLVHLNYRHTRETGAEAAADEEAAGDDADSEPAELIGTTEHPFWSLTRDQWVGMAELKVGEHLLLSDGQTAIVTHLRFEDAEPGETFTTYNFEVEDWHAYFVAESTAQSDAPGIWVHNACKTEQPSIRAVERNTNRVGGSGGETRHLADGVDAPGGGAIDAARNAHLEDLPIHPDPNKFYVRASELLDDSNIVRRHPLNEKQLLGSPEVGHGGVRNLSNEDLLRSGGPQGNDPIRGFRSLQAGDAPAYPVSRIHILGGHHRLSEIARRVRSGEIGPNILIEFLIEN